MSQFRILAINPGSTSTKISVYDDSKEILTQTLRHSSEELAEFTTVAQQFKFRKDLVVDALTQAGIELGSVSAFIGRGGLVKPIPSGVYEVNDALKADLINPPQGEHASNLGGLIAADLAASTDGRAKAYIADPVVVDELSDVARIAGHKLFKRVSIFHALNQKAVAREYAHSIGKHYNELNLIVAHLGGGVSVGAHKLGRVIDVNNALDGEGPFSPERSGTLPAGQLVELCFSGEYSKKEIKKMLCGEGGMISLLNTNSVKDIVESVDKVDLQAAQILDAFCYNVGKSIGSVAAALEGKVDAIIITGGIAYSSRICSKIQEMVSFIAPITVIPGEDEMQALSDNALNILLGKEIASIYK